MSRLALALGIAAVLAACGGNPSSRADLAAHAERARQPAELQVGDVRIHASLVPTASLNAAIAQRYGVAPGRNVHLLLVGVRRGAVHDEASLPARISTRARDLRGAWQDVPMRELRSDGFIDYVGAVRAAPPDTLSFEILVRREDAGATDVLRFDRDIFP
ncbi:MAG TPA: DUF4426 domain-containing protein [Luteimonas sp.]|nr:DUF4426 domain-containing protein [Luteimonas sp.]